MMSVKLTKFIVWLCASLLVTASFTATAQGKGDSLDRLVSAKQQRELGLDKLTPTQRAGVHRLLVDAFQLGRGEGPGASRTAPSRSVAPTSSVIETQIDGDFEGWEGETVVKLMNGQIWQQVDYAYEYHYAFMPNVLIYSTGGGYKMKVEGVTQAVSVTRLR